MLGQRNRGKGGIATPRGGDFGLRSENVFAGAEPVRAEPREVIGERPASSGDSGQGEARVPVRACRYLLAGAELSRDHGRRRTRIRRAGAVLALTVALAPTSFAIGRSIGERGATTGAPQGGQVGALRVERAAVQERLRVARKQIARLRVELRREARQRYAWQQWARVFDARRYQQLIAAAKRRGRESTQR